MAPTNKTIDTHEYLELSDAKDKCKICGEVFEAHATPNPQETVDENETLQCTNCGKRTPRFEAEDRNFNQGRCGYCGGWLEPVPQESSPGFEELVRKLEAGNEIGPLARLELARQLRAVYETTDMEAYKRGFQEAEPLYRKEIQAAKRESKQAGYRHVANYMDATPSDTSDEVKRAWAEVREFLNKHLEEETTS